ncbi:MAG: hypothetical protein CM15mP54_28500 [Paracoccaceae bacterium]|nr:MAG: hypothetical protein CM15mP54_28500 [Paracoccaceae bacterium]
MLIWCAHPQLEPFWGNTGAGGVISSFTSYAVAKASSKPGEKYGEGEEGGVVATESATTLPLAEP